jgi:hypothetical protein
VARFSPPEHSLIRFRDAKRLTGRTVEDLQLEMRVQSLVRVRPNGKREEMLRIPDALLLQPNEDA